LEGKHQLALRLVKPEIRADGIESPVDVVDALYDAHAADVTRWARRLAGPTMDIEDVVHDVFLVALQRVHTFQGNSGMRTWLFRITHHVVCNRRRRRFLRGLLFRRREDEMVAALPAPPTPLQEMERHEEHERLYRALDRLADCYRTAIILYDIEGLSSSEVSELTDVPVGTVWVRLHRGRAKLFELLTREGES
jgi:RNA polymerase sigma-70 factor, ECF subfamily